MENVAEQCRSVEQTGVSGVLALVGEHPSTAGSRPADFGPEHTAEVVAGLREGIAREVAKAMLLVQRELADLEVQRPFAEAAGLDMTPRSRGLQRLARIQRSIHGLLDAQRAELEALERKLQQ